jgi:hypothetical protein
MFLPHHPRACIVKYDCRWKICTGSSQPYLEHIANRFLGEDATLANMGKEDQLGRRARLGFVPTPVKIDDRPPLPGREP